MKKQILNLLWIAILGITLNACGGNEAKEGETDKPELDLNTEVNKQDIRKVVKAYLELKDALVSSDVNQAKIASKKLSGKAIGDIRSNAETLYATDDLKKQREIFNTISVSMYDLLKKDNNAPMTLYKQFCPMAFDNKGAFWLSEEEAIKNPYFGDEMMNCGEVKETLAAN